MSASIRESFGGLDVFVANARPDIEHFYRPVMEIPLEKSLCRYFAAAPAQRRITVNAIGPGATENSVFNTLLVARGPQK
ncbi:MAG TPA: hypothetical protein VE993_19430 [Stellaceae bacterium]|nr:hypothetical protein [Stellaceae bacterium]